MSNHFVISMVKSAIRIVACITGAILFYKTNQAVASVFVGLVGAEVIGIIEEIGE